MPDPVNDPLVADAIESPARSAEVVLRVLRDLALTTMCAALAVAAVYVARAAQDVSRLTATQRVMLAEQQATLAGSVAAALASISETTTHVDRVTDEAAATLAHVRGSTLLQVDAAVGSLRDRTDQLGPAIATTTAHVDSILGHADDMVMDADTLLRVNGDELGKVLVNLRKTSDNIVIITAPDQYAEVLDGVRAATAALGDTMQHVDVVAANSADVSTYYRQKIIPQPYRPTGPWWLRGLKYTGHYSLQVLKATPQLAVIGLQLAR